ncbi:MAG: HPF/RaiA family ribosome-associated protein [Planctomycetaceae bacterium]
MQVQVHTDNHVHGSAELSSRVAADVSDALRHYGPQITRVEVHLTDVNSSKKGEDDKRCLMEARVSGFDPIAASHHAGTIDEAIAGAIDVLHRNLERAIGKLGHKKGRMSASGE